MVVVALGDAGGDLTADTGLEATDGSCVESLICWSNLATDEQTKKGGRRQDVLFLRCRLQGNQYRNYSKSLFAHRFLLSIYILWLLLCRLVRRSWLSSFEDVYCVWRGDDFGNEVGFVGLCWDSDICFVQDFLEFNYLESFSARLSVHKLKSS